MTVGKRGIVQFRDIHIRANDVSRDVRSGITMTTCPKCSRSIFENESVCSNCGTAVDPGGKALLNITVEAGQSFESRIEQATRTELERWSVDPSCAQRDLAVHELEKRRHPAPRQPIAGVSQPAIADHPKFDPRTEVSADAKYITGRIVKHLWIIFVLLPFVVGLLVYLLRS